MTKFSILSAACIAAALGGIACGSDADESPMPGGGGTTNVPPGAGPGGSEGVAPDEGGVLTKAADLSDPEMLNVLHVTSVADFRRAQIAENKAQNPAVRAYATKLARDATIVDYSAAVTGKSMGVTPSTNEVGAMVTRAGDAFTQGMNAKPTGIAFDRAYMDVQIEAADGTIAMVEQMLITAEAVPLRSLLTETVEAAQRHFDEAVLIRYSLK